MNLRDILHTPRDVPGNWNSFTQWSKEKHSELVPSVVLTDSRGILIQDFSDFNGIINANIPVPFFKSLEITTSLASFGVQKIHLSGRIYNLRNYISSGAFARLFNNFNQFKLYYGWGKYSTYPSTERFGSFYSYVYCNLITYKIRKVDAFSYEFDMDLLSNIMNLERDLNLEMFNISFTFDRSDTIIKDGVKTKIKYAALKDVIDPILTSLNKLAVITKNNTRSNKIITVKYEDIKGSVDNKAFVDGSKNIGNLKIIQSLMQSTSLFKGNLRTVLTNLLTLTDPTVARKITFFIDEDKENTIITFYNVDDEFDKFKQDDPIVVNLYEKNSIIKDVDFDYEKPLYSLSLLKLQRNGQFLFGQDSESQSTLKQFAKELGWDYEKLQEAISGKTLAQVPTTKQEVGDPTNKNKTGNENLSNVLMAFVGIRCNLSSLGFTGFHPGQGFSIKNDILFEGKYILNEVKHRIEPGSFTTNAELICLEASDAVKKLFGIEDQSKEVDYSSFHIKANLQKPDILGS